MGHVVTVGNSVRTPTRTNPRHQISGVFFKMEIENFAIGLNREILVYIDHVF